MQRKIDLIKKRESEAIARLSQRAAEKEQRELDRIANARAWRRRDFMAACLAESETELSPAERAEADEKMELCLSSNEAVDLVREGRLDAAERAAKDLLERFPDAHDGHDRLGMVHEARGEKRQAAECYRKAIAVIRQHPDDFGSSLKKTFEELVKQLDPPAKRARSGSARKGQSKPPAA
jgi:tetratricopeptide (TPR) repeat protein